MTEFINAELESELESDTKLELKSELECDAQDCSVFTHSNFVLNHRKLLTGFKRVIIFIS